MPSIAARSVLVCLLACCLCLGPVFSQSADNSYWQGQSIYQIITDRFFDGDPSNNNAEGNYNPSSSGSVHGGDFKGIEQKLDYIKALGATAIWISPVVRNGHSQFHGYAATDFYHVAPHWGSLADLQHLIQAAHARGILVIDDIVVNHGDDLIYSTDSGYSTFVAPPSGYTLKYRSSSVVFAPPFDTYNASYTSANNALTNLFHNNGAIANFNDDTQVTLGELSGLDDFRTESAYVRAQMTAIYEYWIGQAGFDGFRIDTTKHVDMGFWQAWCPAVHAYAATNGLPNFFMFGEVEDGSESKCGSYTGTMGGGAFKEDSVVDYPLYFMVNNVFASATGNTKQIEDHYNAVAANYDPAAQMRLVTFLDNHDQPRFLSVGGATADRLKVALSFLYTSRGVPCLYYGTEQGFNGTTDPNDREDMFAGQFKDGPAGVDSFNMTHPLFQLIALLNNFRRLYPALQTGSHVNKWNDPTGPGLFAYARRLANEEVFVVLNTSTSAQTLTNRSTTLAAGTPIINLFDTNEVLTVEAGPQTPLIAMPGTSAKIFVAQPDWKPLDPVVISNFPAHDAQSVRTDSSIVLRFSKPMDTNSVQSAFSATPAFSGLFFWSAAHDAMAFTPAGNGLPPLTTVVVRLTNTAFDAVSGNSFYAPYLMQFHTAATVDPTPPAVTLINPTNQALVSGNLVISGSASDNVAVQKVEISLDGGAWFAASGTTSWTFALNSSNFLNGAHTISARATDASGNLSQTNSASVRFLNIPGAYMQRVSGGNPNSVVDCAGNMWAKDLPYSLGGFGYSGGTTGYVANSIINVCAQAQSLYQRERYSTNSAGDLYQFDCPIGVYEVTLLEAETYWNAPNKRKFNVYIQGRQVLTNYDIYAAAGAMNTPVSLVFTNAVPASRLQVLFTPVTDNARVSGIQARKIADLYSDTDGIPDWWRIAYFGHALGSASDHSRAGDDADGDGVSNLTEFLLATDPANAASSPTKPSFNVTAVTQNQSTVQLACDGAASNWTYQLQVRDTLDGGSPWTNTGPPILGSGAAVIFPSIDPKQDATRYFRVQAR